MQEIVHTVLKLGAAADFRLWLRLYGCGGARVAKNKNENKKLKKKKLLSPRINKRKSEETTAKHTHTHYCSATQLFSGDADGFSPPWAKITSDSSLTFGACSPTTGMAIDL